MFLLERLFYIIRLGLSEQNVLEHMFEYIIVSFLFSTFILKSIKNKSSLTTLHQKTTLKMG